MEQGSIGTGAAQRPDDERPSRKLKKRHKSAKLEDKTNNELDAGKIVEPEEHRQGEAVGKEKVEVEKFERLPGEPYKKFKARLAAYTRAQQVKEIRSSRTTSQKRKSYLVEKKKRKQRQRQQQQQQRQQRDTSPEMWRENTKHSAGVESGQTFRPASMGEDAVRKARSQVRAMDQVLAPPEFSKKRKPRSDKLFRSSRMMADARASYGHQSTSNPNPLS